MNKLECHIMRRKQTVLLLDNFLTRKASMVFLTLKRTNKKNTVKRCSLNEKSMLAVLKNDGKRLQSNVSCIFAPSSQNKYLNFVFVVNVSLLPALWILIIPQLHRILQSSLQKMNTPNKLSNKMDPTRRIKCNHH